MSSLICLFFSFRILPLLIDSILLPYIFCCESHYFRLIYFSNSYVLHFWTKRDIYSLSKLDLNVLFLTYSINVHLNVFISTDRRTLTPATVQTSRKQIRSTLSPLLSPLKSLSPVSHYCLPHPSPFLSPHYYCWRV